MPDILIRDVPDDVVAAIDARAHRAGLSRTEYLCRTLSRERADDTAGVTVDDLARFGRAPLAAMPIEYMTPAIEDRAVTVQGALADRGRHRAPPIPDLLNAATAEFAQLTVLHVDRDYELIAEVTGQVVEQLRLK